MDDPNQTPQESEAISTGTTIVPLVHAANSAYHQPTIAKLMAYLNATIDSLPVKTLCRRGPSGSARCIHSI
jgi:hypothetical protein